MAKQKLSNRAEVIKRNLRMRKNFETSHTLHYIHTTLSVYINILELVMIRILEIRNKYVITNRPVMKPNDIIFIKFKKMLSLQVLSPVLLRRKNTSDLKSASFEGTLGGRR